MVTEIRLAIASLQAQTDKNLVEAGRCMGAALGALALAEKADADERALRLQQSGLLLARAMTAWLQYVSTQPLPAELAHIGGAFRLLCDEGQKAMAGSQQARQEFDRRVSAIRKQISGSN